ncbi:MAG TPA: sugar phosphate isomerase/epimerase family protein [Verrucomicrobiae bacterium]|nr:sugar phosphate isomerase/epimerase family protein [Verrucomicrobiae bacterium]
MNNGGSLQTRRAFLLSAGGGALASAVACTRRRTGLRCGVASYTSVDPLADVEKLVAAGADYAEPSLSKTMTLSDADFEVARRKVEGSGIRVESMNWFVPPEVRLTGPDVDGAKVKDYVARALGRAEALGAKRIVFGSPGARNVPDGFPKDKALAQLRAFLVTCGTEIETKRHGMFVCVEPLARNGSNIINSTGEGAAIVREVGHPKIRLMVDFYHWALEKESPETIIEAGPLIEHMHISRTDEMRTYPGDPGEDPRYRVFFQAAHQIGYAQRISLEGNVKDLVAEARAGLRCVRELSR